MEPEGVSCISEDLADNSREECLPQTAVAKISAHAAGNWEGLPEANVCRECGRRRPLQGCSAS